MSEKIVGISIETYNEIERRAIAAIAETPRLRNCKEALCNYMLDAYLECGVIPDVSAKGRGE